MSWIDGLNEWAGVWAQGIIRASWQGGVALVIVWSISRFVKAVPANIKVWLWRIAYCKLLLALFCSAAIDLPVLPLSFGEPERPRVAVAAEPPQTSQGGAAPLPSILNGAIGTSRAISNPNETAVEISKQTLTTSVFVFLLWLLGVLLCGVRLGCHWRKAAVIRQNSVLSDPSCQSLCNELATLFGLWRAPQVLESLQVKCPVLIGIVRPAIILPVANRCPLAPHQLRLVLAHELAHLRRRDLLWLWLSAVAEALFFFYPIVWLARRECSLMQEVACDELALRAVSAPASDYAAVLLDCVAMARSQSEPALMTLGMFETKQTLKRRLMAMKQFKFHSGKRFAIIMAALLAFGAIAVLPWRVVAQNEPASKDELTRLKEENAKLRDELGKLKAELNVIAQEKNGIKQTAAELEATKARLRELLRKYTPEHPQVKETQNRITALELLEKLQHYEKSATASAQAQREYKNARNRFTELHWPQGHPVVESAASCVQCHGAGANAFLSQHGTSELARDRAGSSSKREELKQLIREEISLVERQLKEAQKLVAAGLSSDLSEIPLQREILRLKRELMQLE